MLAHKSRENGKNLLVTIQKKANGNINLHYWEDNRTELELKLSLFEDSHNYTTENVKFCRSSSNHAHSHFSLSRKKNPSKILERFPNCCSAFNFIQCQS